MNDEIKEILSKMERLIVYGQYNAYYDLEKQLLDYITNLQEELKYNDLVIKALHKHFTEHEEYENNELLRQLENCTENDIVWLRRMAGDKD